MKYFSSDWDVILHQGLQDVLCHVRFQHQMVVGLARLQARLQKQLVLTQAVDLS